jgi:hypothetical protein
MKIILAGLAFALLVAAPAFAQPQRNEGSPASAIHLKQKKQLGVDYRDLYLSARKSNLPTSNPGATQDWLCRTAHDFCPGFHGDNG